VSLIGSSRYTSRRQRIRLRTAGRKGVSPSSPPIEIRNMILDDAYLMAAYGEQYLRLAEQLPAGKDRLIVELGAGTGIGGTWIPGMVCSDISPSNILHAGLDATKLPFRDESITAFVLKDALHHVSNVERLLDEVSRCLVVGGVMAACEPYWGVLASVIYRFLHPEPFQKRQQGWSFDAQDTWDSNQALAWILLRRDRDKLALGWPRLSLEEAGPLPGPSYLLSGGVFGRSRIPSSWLLALHGIETRVGRPLDPFRFEFAFTLRKSPESAITGE